MERAAAVEILVLDILPSPVYRKCPDSLRPSIFVFIYLLRPVCHRCSRLSVVVIDGRSSPTLCNSSVTGNVCGVVHWLTSRMNIEGQPMTLPG